MPKSEKEIPEIDEKELEDKARKDPKSKNYNNKNSRKNLKQYQTPVVPEIVEEDDLEDAENEVHAQTIVAGRKLNPKFVKKLLPQRGVLTAAEKKRFVGIVEMYLSVFKNEDPMPADLDDIYEIAESDIMKTRLLKESKDSPDMLVQVNQALERIYKRKQTAKENLAARRSDRKNTRTSQDISIVDLVVQYDLEQRRAEEQRIAKLLEEEEKAAAQLNEVLEKDGY